MKGCRPITRLEERALYKNIDNPRDACLLTLGFKTGYRISELLSLHIRDVATPQGVIFSEIYITSTKNGEGRSVPLHNEARKSLKKWVSCLLNAGYSLCSPLFIGRKKTNRSITRQQAWRILKSLFELAQVYGGKLATHSMRKTFASRLKETLSLEELQAALGHKSITSTIAYVGLATEKVHAAILDVC